MAEELEIQTAPAPSDRDILTRAVATNIATLRQSRKMTQLELGEALNYSDKAISKWERAEAVPDAFVLSDIARMFGVTVDWLLTSHEGESLPPPPETDRRHRHSVIALLSFFGTWTAATIAFVVLAMLGVIVWQVFIYALPASLTVLLVLNSCWGKRATTFLLIAALVASCLFTVNPIRNINARNAKHSSLHGAINLKVCYDFIHNSCGDGKAIAAIASCLAIEHCIDAYQFASFVDKCATRITTIDSGIGLYETLDAICSERTCLSTYNTGCDGAREIEGIANCQHPLAKPKFVAVAYFNFRQTFFVNLD